MTNSLIAAVTTGTVQNLNFAKMEYPTVPAFLQCVGTLPVIPAPSHQRAGSITRAEQINVAMRSTTIKNTMMSKMIVLLAIAEVSSELYQMNPYARHRMYLVLKESAPPKSDDANELHVRVYRQVKLTLLGDVLNAVDDFMALLRVTNFSIIGSYPLSQLLWQYPAYKSLRFESNNVDIAIPVMYNLDIHKRAFQLGFALHDHIERVYYYGVYNGIKINLHNVFDAADPTRDDDTGYCKTWYDAQYKLHGVDEMKTVLNAGTSTVTNDTSFDRVEKYRRRGFTLVVPEKMIGLLVLTPENLSVYTAMNTSAFAHLTCLVFWGFALTDALIHDIEKSCGLTERMSSVKCPRIFDTCTLGARELSCIGDYQNMTFDGESVNTEAFTNCTGIVRISGTVNISRSKDLDVRVVSISPRDYTTTIVYLSQRINVEITGTDCDCIEVSDSNDVSIVTDSTVDRVSIERSHDVRIVYSHGTTTKRLDITDSANVVVQPAAATDTTDDNGDAPAPSKLATRLRGLVTTQ